MSCIYTQAELLLKIKALDTKIESSIATSKLDTGQSIQTFTIDIIRLEVQRNRYYKMLQQYYPANYGDIVALNTKRR